MLEDQPVKNRKSGKESSIFVKSFADVTAEIRLIGAQLSDIKSFLENFEGRIRNLERVGDKTTPLTEKRIELLEKISEFHNKELKDLKDLITATAHNVDKLSVGFNDMQKIWKWALGIFTVVMTAMIILFITGQAYVVFK
jgi:uncharacterized coiled-coil protein SlyX